MRLINLRCSSEITQRDEKSAQHTQGDDPDALEQAMPELPKIESTLRLRHHVNGRMGGWRGRSARASRGRFCCQGRHDLENLHQFNAFPNVCGEFSTEP